MLLSFPQSLILSRMSRIFCFIYKKTTFAKNRDFCMRHEAMLCAYLFELLKSGKCYRSVKSKTTRFRNSFHLEAIRYMNGEGGLSSKRIRVINAGTHTFITFGFILLLF